MKHALLSFTGCHEASLDLAEDAQYELLHVHVLLQQSAKFGDSEPEDLDFIRQSLSELLLVLLEGHPALILLTSIASLSAVLGSRVRRAKATVASLHLDRSARAVLLIGAITAGFTLAIGCLLCRWLLLEEGHCEPLLSRFSLQCLQDDVEFEAELGLAHSCTAFFGVDRVAGPLDDGVVANAVDLAELGEHFLHFVLAVEALTTLVHLDHLFNDLALTVRSGQQLIEDLFVAFNTCLQVLQAFLRTVQDCLDEDGAVLDDLKQLVTGLFGEDGVSDELELGLIRGGHLLVLLSLAGTRRVRAIGREVLMELWIELLPDFLDEAELAQLSEHRAEELLLLCRQIRLRDLEQHWLSLAQVSARDLAQEQG